MQGRISKGGIPMTKTFPFEISARRYDTPPERLVIEAYNPAHALQAAQELFPECICSAVAVAPEWGDVA